MTAGSTQPQSPAATAAAPPVPSLIAGKWIVQERPHCCDVFNPSTGQVIARVGEASTEDVDAAVRAAQGAFADWSAIPVIERARILFRCRELLLERLDEIALCVSRENGKTLAEARAGVNRGIEVVEFACAAPSLLMGQALPELARGVDCETVRHPLGVCVGITPFNFPVMVPMWMFPIAIVCGNTFVLKPSEKVPLSANLVAEICADAGLPPGVLNVVHGGRQAVDALLAHELVRAVSFVGSTGVAKYIYETATRQGKRVQAAGGAKNHLIIMPDADLNQAVSAVLGSAFGCAGERCMAGSVGVPLGDIAGRFVDMLCEKAARMTVGATDEGAAVDMGPLISDAHCKRVAGYMDIARAEGAAIALDGRCDLPAGNGFFLRPSVVDRVRPDMRLATEEIFGPLLSVVRAASLDEAIAFGARSPYGNGASIFTSSGYAARQFKQHYNAGMIGINVGVPAPMAWFPFTGWNQSFFGDLHIQGTEAIQFYTRQKTTTTRWFAGAAESPTDPLWRSR